MKTRGLKLFFDGGCRPNPGAIETAIVARGVVYHRPAQGYGTNNDAEWRAALHALDVAQMLGATDIILIGDSAVVITQANGTAKCRSADLRIYLEQFQERRRPFARVRMRQVKRTQNLAGIALARIA